MKVVVEVAKHNEPWFKDHHTSLFPEVETCLSNNLSQALTLHAGFKKKRNTSNARNQAVEQSTFVHEHVECAVTVLEGTVKEKHVLQYLGDAMEGYEVVPVSLRVVVSPMVEG